MRFKKVLITILLIAIILNTYTYVNIQRRFTDIQQEQTRLESNITELKFSLAKLEWKLFIYDKHLHPLLTGMVVWKNGSCLINGPATTLYLLLYLRIR